MSRGGPDYGNPDYTFFTVETPTSDIVATLQGFSRLDNRGRVLWFEDWRNGVTRMIADYNNTATQVQHTVAIGTGIGNHGVVKLDPLANNGFAGVIHHFVLPVSKRIGLEIGVQLSGSNGQISINLEHNYAGATRNAGVLRFQSNGASIAVQTSGGDQTFYTPASFTYLQDGIISVKFVIDVSTNKYVRAMIGNQEYDLSAYTLLASSNGLVGDTFISVYCEGTSATNRQPVYVAYIIISGDEP